MSILLNPASPLYINGPAWRRNSNDKENIQSQTIIAEKEDYKNNDFPGFFVPIFFIFFLAILLFLIGTLQKLKKIK